MSQRAAVNPAPAPGGSREPIAIVGIGCRFPGGADSPEAFWKLLCAGVDAIGSMPRSRFPQELYDDSPPLLAGKIASRQGGFLDRLDEFDAAFFGISPREAAAMDPQQRLLLETAWEALADAGIRSEELAGSSSGVYVAMWTNEYEDTMFAASDDVDLYVTTGGGRYAASGRLSYVFDLQGPSLTVDTACSSSLVATHLACQSLWTGETGLALVGAVNLIFQPSISIGYSRSRMLSPDGRCKFGDARADGYVRSEGCAVLALKPLAKALSDGDQIYALIRSTATNNDGHSSGLLVAPSGQGQLAMLREAYHRAGISPGEVAYVEAHGTGTPVGDPVELKALGAVLAEGRAPDRPCIVGSVKTNIGHTEAASGLAGLIKAALCLKYGAIPASLHFETPNPSIPWSDLPLKVQPNLIAWPESGGRRYAGVNSFGVTGTNAHVVLEAAPVREGRKTPIPAAGALLLPISAQSASALTELARAYAELLTAETAQWADVCYSASLRATHLGHRLAVVASDSQGLVAGIEAFLRGEPHAALNVGQAAPEPPRVAFVFPGQGSQWLGMARELLVGEPAFRAALEQCDKVISAETGWSPMAQLLASEADSRLDEIDVIQPTLFAVQVALAALWRAWGIVPTAVVGHSMGEIAAAHVAGALSLEDAAAIICRRSRLLRRVRGQGAMAVVDLSLAEAQGAIKGYEDQIAIAVSNSPRSTVLSGDPTTLAAVVAKLERREVFCRPVKVDVASHSPQMDPLLAELEAVLAGLAPQSAQVPIYSTVAGAVVEGATLVPGYWARNLRQPVLFATAVAQIAASGSTIFIEISPHPILLPAIEQVLRHAAHEGVALPTLRRAEPERVTMLTTLGALYTAGVPLSWTAHYPAGGRFVRLPAYPWQRERFWYEHPATAGPKARGGHPLLGFALRPAASPGTVCWQTTLDRRRMAYLVDHQVRGSAILPATGFVTLALAAAAELDARPYALDQLELREALSIPEVGERAIQLVLEQQTHERLYLRVYGEDGDGGAWRLHAEARLGAGTQAPDHEAPAVIVARCREQLTTSAFYTTLGARALTYGPAFQTVTSCWLGEGEALGQLHLSTSADQAAAVQIVLLDGCLQLAVAALPEPTAGQTFLPVSIEQLQVFAWPARDAALWGHAVLRDGDETGYCYDVTLLDSAGLVLAAIKGVRLQGSERAAGAKLAELLYELRWEQAERLASAATMATRGSWLIIATGDDAANLAHQLTSRGERCVLATPGVSYRQVGPERYELEPADRDAYGALLRAAFGPDTPPCRGIVYALGATMPELDAAASLAAAEQLGCAGVVALVQALGATGWGTLPRLWLLSHGAQQVSTTDAPAAAQALLWGLGRVVATEHPELRCTLIDLDPAGGTAGGPELVVELLAGASGPADTQVALRGAARYVARLAHWEEGGAQVEPSQPGPRGGELEAYRLVAMAPGQLESLRPRSCVRRVPGPGEIEVRVESAGLNFIDVLKALGIYPGLEASPELALGAECAGTVVAVGDGVATFAPGDHIVAITPAYTESSMLSAYVTLPAIFAVPRSDHLSAEQASALPVALLTAYYALHELGRLRKGERVLIHAAAGGVGLAALQVCRRAGAEVFATAGSPAKRDYLHSLGITHVFDSRALDFADQVLALTGGRGVDLVLNSLTGEAIQRSLDALAPRGRFLEIGKRDIYANSRIGLEPFKKNLSFFAIDLARLTDEDPAYVAGLFREVMGLVAAGELEPLPTEVFPLDEAPKVFRKMAQAQHTGKLVLSLRKQPAVVEPAPLLPLRADATYLVTGGLGGLGLEVARWLVQRGARHLALLARSAPGAAARAAIAALEAEGVHVVALAADVARADQLGPALAQLAQTLPPLRGIVHAAGVLADATVDALDRERLHTALAPKLWGGWNLHTLTREQPLDFFVLFSSVAAQLGLAGQANYAAANAFLDGLARQRRAAGLPALSIGWGPWAEVGLAAAAANRGERLAERGLGSLSPAEGVAALDHLLCASPVEATVMRFDSSRWLTHEPGAASLLAQLHDHEAPAVAPVRQGLRPALLAVEPGRRRRALLEEAVRAQLAQVLRIAPERIDRQRPLKALGLDSLMALELRNRLEVESGLTLSATIAWNYPTIAVLAEYLAGRMELALEAQTEPITAEAGAASEEQGEAIDLLADDELEALLSDELAAVERLLKAE